MANFVYISWVMSFQAIVILLYLTGAHADEASEISKASKNLWDTITAQGVNPHGNISEYEKKLCRLNPRHDMDCYNYVPTCDDYNGFRRWCTNESVIKNCIYSCGKCQDNNGSAQICNECDYWDGRQDECGAQPFCYWKCNEGKCVARDNLDQICNLHCVSFCDCQREWFCYHTSISNSFRDSNSDAVETVTDVNIMSCKPVYKICNLNGHGNVFRQRDCLRSNTGNNYYFLYGYPCSAPESFDQGNCDIEKEIINGKFPTLSVVETLVFSQSIEQGSYELLLQLDRIDFTNGNTQIYTIYINGMKLNMKFHEIQLIGKERADITVVVYFVAEKREPNDKFPPETWTLEVKGYDANWILGNLTVTTKHSNCDGANDFNTFTSFSLRKLKKVTCEDYHGNACSCAAANSLCSYNEITGLCTVLSHWSLLSWCTWQPHHSCVFLPNFYDSVSFDNGGVCGVPTNFGRTFCNLEEVMEAVDFNGPGFDMPIPNRITKIPFRSDKEIIYNEAYSNVTINRVDGSTFCGDSIEFRTYVTNNESKSGCLHFNVSIPVDGTYELFIAGISIAGIPHVFDVRLEDKLLIQGLDIWKLIDYKTCRPLKIYKFFNVTQDATHLSCLDSKFEMQIKEKQIKVSFCNSECEQVKYKNFMVSAFAVFRYKTSGGGRKIVVA